MMRNVLRHESRKAAKSGAIKSESKSKSAATLEKKCRMSHRGCRGRPAFPFSWSMAAESLPTS